MLVYLGFFDMLCSQLLLKQLYWEEIHTSHASERRVKAVRCWSSRGLAF